MTTISQPLTEVTSSAPGRVDRPFRGIALILTSTVFLGTSDVTAKYLTHTLPAVEIAWLRFLVFALIMVPAMIPGSPLFALRTGYFNIQILRGATLLLPALGKEALEPGGGG